MEKIDTILAYKNSLKIIQDKDAYSYSIDSCLLSFFIKLKKKEKGIIDLGTGSGAIPLYLSMFTKSKIYGVEIQEDASIRAKRSVELNKLTNQIEILNMDIKDLPEIFPKHSFSIVVSNPPYFRLNDTALKNANPSLLIARHEVLINMEDIIKVASYLLIDGGSINLVQKTDRFLETLELLNNYRLTPKRVRFVYPKMKKDSYIFLIEAVKNAPTHGFKIEEPLYIYNEKSEYSKEVLEYFHYGEENEEIK